MVPPQAPSLILHALLAPRSSRAKPGWADTTERVPENLSQHHERRRPRRAGRGALALAALAGAAAAVALERRRHRDAQARLEARAAEREAERARLSGQLVTAEQDERRRLSLSLHDGPLQSLSGIALLHDAALRALDEGRQEEARRVLDSALARERETIQTLRDLSFAMEPVVLRDHGFEAAVSTLADQVRAARGIELEVDVVAGEQLGEKAQVALYQTLREALDQAVRRRPSRIRIRIERAGDGVAATVEDDGVAERRRGNADAMRERAGIVNGRVSMEAPPGGGTTVRVTLPSYTAAV